MFLTAARHVRNETERDLNLKKKDLEDLTGIKGIQGIKAKTWFEV
jgi:hypothetical protein